LYRRMRGTGPVTGAATSAVGGARGADALSPAGESGETVELLRAIKADVEAVRRAVETGGPGD
jgi:hypothetical protein